MVSKYSPIGFFDSGIGGISVLKKAVKLLPKEDFIYYGDSKNAPYGKKRIEEVKTLTLKATEILINMGIKALVIACNTATSAAIESLRQAYPKMPVIGIEPALKPAVELNRPGKIVIMGTSMTLSEKKFHNLLLKYKDKADIVPIPCPGLVELIEKGIISGEDVKEFLSNRLLVLGKANISSIVLGCTHYPFIIKELCDVIGDMGYFAKVIDSEEALNNERSIEDVIIIDGSIGTSKQLKRKLISNNLLRTDENNGKVRIYNSSEEEEIIKLSNRLLW